MIKTTATLFCILLSTIMYTQEVIDPANIQDYLYIECEQNQLYEKSGVSCECMANSYVENVKPHERRISPLTKTKLIEQLDKSCAEGTKQVIAGVNTIHRGVYVFNLDDPRVKEIMGKGRGYYTLNGPFNPCQLRNFIVEKDQGAFWFSNIMTINRRLMQYSKKCK